MIGSNGAGKSTLLNALAGTCRSSAAGSPSTARDVTRWPAAARARLVARVFQDPMAGTCATLTIEENMALADARGRRRGLAPGRGRDAARAACASGWQRLGLGLENRLGDRMGLLSGGQRQAVSLLMATLAPSKILLLDEHTAALDPRTAEFVLELTPRLVAEQRLTTLMVTHSMRQALTTATARDAARGPDRASTWRARPRPAGRGGPAGRVPPPAGRRLDEDALLLNS